MAVTGRMIFPLNVTSRYFDDPNWVRRDETTFETAMDGTNVYSTKAGSTAKEYAYKNVSVNPLLVTLGADNETDYVSADSGNPPIASTIYTEIRKGPHTGLPTVTSKLLECENVENTARYKVKIFDSNEDITTTNRKVTYSSTPDSNTSLDIETYDYFILLNPELIPATGRDSGVSESGSNKTTIRPHFAKITRIITFDSFGDGVEFSPKYSGEIPIGTNIEIFRGPAKTETDIVAVSYGLRGDTDADTDKYDKICRVNRPTFYFYNDRLEEEDQLDYNEKYTLTSYRDWSNSTNITITTVVGSLSQFEEGSTSKYYKVSSTDFNKLTKGMSLFKSDGTYLGNIEDLYIINPLGDASYRLYLDYLRPSSNVSNGDTVTIGKTAQNVVFKTERKYDDTIRNLGRDRLDAVLVDKYLTSDEADGDFNPIFWHKAFVDMKRSATNSTTATSASDGGRNGPSRYITFESAALKNDKIPLVTESIVNNPKNKIAKICEIKTLDNAGIVHLKYKENDKMVVRNGLYTNTMKIRKLEHTVTTNSTKLEFNNNSKVNDDASYDDDYTAILTTGSIIEVGDYYYRVNVVDAKADETKQGFTVSHNRLKTAATWTASATPPTVTNADIYIVPYSNGKFNLGFAADTEIKPAQSNRILLEGHTIDKEDTKLYNSKITMNGFVGHDIKVDYGDKDLKYVAIQDASRKYYQNSPIDRMYYYSGGFTLHEEVFEGKVEDLTSSSDSGILEYKILGRDKTANLLSQNTDKRLSFSDDIIGSTLNPNLTLTSVTSTVINVTEGSTTVTIVGDKTSTLVKYTLLFNDSKELIGEVSSSSYSSPNTTVTLLDNSLVSISNGSQYYYCNPFATSSLTSLNKAMASNPLLTNHATDLDGASNKGLVFEKGYSLNTSLEKTDLNLSATIIDENRLGYDISNIGSISNFDSSYLFKLADEKDALLTNVVKTIQSSNYLSVVDVIESESNKSVIDVSAQFPITLGLIDVNSSDTRINATHTKAASIYLLNNNLPKGGYIHRLNNTFNNFYTSKDIFRYVDLQSFNPGTIVYDDSDSIYREGKTPSKISGYTIAHNISVEGSDKDAAITTNDNLSQIFTETGTTNTIYTGNVFTTDGQSDATTSNYWEMNALTADTRSNANTLRTSYQDKSNLLVQNDYRCRTYELLCYGDLFPNSYLRYNNVSHNGLSDANSFSITDYGILWEGKGLKEGEQTHSSYNGKTLSTRLEDKDYDLSTISESSLTYTKNLRRWGVIRLTEATFDWHFNAIDSDALKSREEIPRVPITTLTRFSDKESGVSWNSTNRPSFSLRLSSDDYLYSVGDTNTFGGNSTGVNFTLAYFAIPNLALTHKDELYFSYNALKNGSNYGFDVHNVFLPLLPQVSSSDNTANAKTFIESPFHYGIIDAPTGSIADGANGSLYHTSTVISAMASPILGGATGITVPHYYADFPSKTIYDNCVGVFRNIMNITNKDDTNLYDFDSSSLLTISSGYYNSDNIDLSTNDQNQHSKNLLVREGFNQGGLRHLPIAMIGMKTANYPLVNSLKNLNVNKITGDNDADTVHNETTANNDEYGKAFAAQMLIKPQFNIVSGDYSSTPSVITRTMDTSSTHHWLHYMPDLTGHYIVGPDITSKGTPSYIGKIISHTKKVTSNRWVHTITFDKDLTAAGQYRLMRISETTFDETPDYFEINVMDDSGLKHDKVFADFRTGGVEGDSKSTNSEGVYSMHMLLELDTANTYLERRLFSNMAMFTDGEEIDTFINDGINTQRKSLTVTKSNSALKFEYDGKISANGCVSFGQVCSLTIPKKINFIPKNCFLGNTVRIGSKVIDAIEEIAIGSGLNVNMENSFKQYTGLIVNSVSSNVITLFNTPTNLSVNDVIYNQNGYLIGVISAKNDGNKTITMGTGVSGDGDSDLIFSPAQYDEITLHKKDTFISNVNFDNVDSFSAIKYLIDLQKLDYKIVKDKLIIETSNDNYKKRKYYVDYRKNNRLISVESNKSLFDKKNKIIVLGDGVKAEYEMPTNSNTKTLRHINSSIKTVDEAKIKAIKLLELHSQEFKKIHLKLQKEGLELLEAGDIITLDFPNHNIPKDDYQVFEVSNVLSGTTEIVVGTFNKNIAERLTELDLESKNSNFTLFTKNSMSANVGKFITDDLDIDQNNIKYAITTVTTTGGIISGFGNTLGFGSTLGFGTATTSTLKEYESEKSEGI